MASRVQGVLYDVLGTFETAATVPFLQSEERAAGNLLDRVNDPLYVNIVTHVNVSVCTNNVKFLDLFR